MLQAPIAEERETRSGHDPSRESDIHTKKRRAGFHDARYRPPPCLQDGPIVAVTATCCVASALRDPHHTVARLPPSKIHPTPRPSLRLNRKDEAVLTRAKFLGGALLSGAVLAAPAARAQTAEQVVIDGARKTLADLRRDKAFGNAQQLLPRARAVLIVPRLLKAGFIFGGSGGNGIVMMHDRGGWSDPAFYAIGSASFGLQAGAEEAEMILLVMTQKGVDGLLRDNFKLGAQAGIAVANLGSGVEGALAGPTPPDVVVWSSATGIYGGLTVDGSIIRSEPDHDRNYYGRPVAVRDILFGHVSSPKAAALLREIDAFG
jgi:lipid-binding SYLF domain-containing protein